MDGVCGRESVRFENCAKLMSTSQFGQLKQALVGFVKESVSGEFNKANVSNQFGPSKHRVWFESTYKFSPRDDQHPLPPPPAFDGKCWTKMSN